MTTPSSASRLTLPVRAGLIAAAAGLALAVVGIIRGVVPANPLSIVLALVISGGAWFVVTWAVTTAVVDVENDAQAAEGAEADDDR